MNRTEHLLDRLRSELGFEPELVGGRKVVLAQIERFFAAEGIPLDLDSISQPALWDRLVSEVVIPETFFFRYPESFSALQDWVRQHPGRGLQILCLPCSTGEEAYSIAITLREAAVSNFHISACDASKRAIANAIEGRYVVRAVRGLPPDQRSLWFHDRGDGICAMGTIRAPIDFQTANIFTFEATENQFDIIFCRNLLIYFEASNQHRIFKYLDRWLKPGGILFLGPGEATSAPAHGWKSTGRPMAFSFERVVEDAPSAISRRSAPPVRKKISAKRLVLKSASPVPRARAAEPKRECEVDWFQSAEEFADAGRLEDAVGALAKFHDTREATASSLLLRGILEEAQGNRTSAEASYRKALYLDPDRLDALLHLSLLLETEGRVQAAIPFRRRAERLTATGT